MPRLKVSEIVDGCGGKLLRGNPDTVVESFSIDTRRLARNGGFFALKGTRTDGHRFLGEAAAAQAALAIVEEEPAADSAAPPALILVENAEAALARCAAWSRKRNTKATWITLSGSNGKTTTKELIAEGLAASRRVHRTPGNYNNHLGLPLTLLAMPDDAELAVIEMAMTGPGEIAQLTRITDPDFGMLTNIRAVHMAAFSSLDDIAAAKGELFAMMRDDAVAVVNLDDLNVRVQAARHVGKRVTFGQHADADVQLTGTDNRFLPGASLTVRLQDQEMRIQLKMGGAHEAQNALAALAMVVAVGEDPAAAARRMEQLEAGPGRGKIHHLGRDVVLVDDSYNCSPPALGAVLETLRFSEPRGRRVLVLGDMLELGEMEVALHREAGKRVAAAGVQLFCAVGPLCREAAETARRAGVKEVHHFDDSRAASDGIAELLSDGDLVVVKGSRSVHLGRIVRALMEAAA